MTADLGIASRANALNIPIAGPAQPVALYLGTLSERLSGCKDDVERYGLIQSNVASLTQRAATAEVIANTFEDGAAAAAALRVVYSQVGDATMLPPTAFKTILQKTLGDTERSEVVEALKIVVEPSIEAVQAIVSTSTYLATGIQVAAGFFAFPQEVDGVVTNPRALTADGAVQVLRVWPKEGDRLAALSILRHVTEQTPETNTKLLTAFDDKTIRGDAERLLAGRSTITVSGPNPLIFFGIDTADRVTVSPVNTTWSDRGRIAAHNALSVPWTYPKAILGAGALVAGAVATGAVTVPMTQALTAHMPEVAAQASVGAVSLLLAGAVLSIGAALWGLVRPVKRVS